MQHQCSYRSIQTLPIPTEDACMANLFKDYPIGMFPLPYFPSCTQPLPVILISYMILADGLIHLILLLFLTILTFLPAKLTSQASTPPF
jgi:hypothetical protein